MGSLKVEFDEPTLYSVFGESAGGSTLLERARASDRRFVRSQTQLAAATPRSTGRILTASEALEAFGFDALMQVTLEGSFPLLSNSTEPAETIRRRRDQMNLPVDRVARAAGIASGELEKIERPGNIARIRDLERVAQALALDERVLGYQPEAGGDRALGVRLRELSDSKDAVNFSAGAVLGLTEAAWVIERQSSLASRLQKNVDLRSKFGFSPDSNYVYPTYEQGYRLAERTRSLLGIGMHDPIESLRSLIEEKLGLPLVQQALEERFAGATLSNGTVRGIVVNERGRNHNVWIRRMTLCHELGHLLWDPDQRLNKLVVDEYDAIGANYRSARDVVEIRANAFAISFLAPPDAIKDIYYSITDPTEIVSVVMSKYGISATAAKWHVTNVTGFDCSSIGTRELPDPSDDWVGRENLAIDYFPIASTPISRRGRFALLVVLALKQNSISVDTAAMYLHAHPDQIRDNLDSIEELLR